MDITTKRNITLYKWLSKMRSKIEGEGWFIL